jgi:hypothetical protein
MLLRWVILHTLRSIEAQLITIIKAAKDKNKANFFIQKSPQYYLL